MENKKKYNTITEEQLDLMVKDIIDKLETAGNENDIDQLVDDCEYLFFDLNDENYTLWTMNARQAEYFVSELRALFEYLLEEYLAVSK